jgi:hypothetical protein
MLLRHQRRVLKIDVRHGPLQLRSYATITTFIDSARSGRSPEPL